MRAPGGKVCWGVIVARPRARGAAALELAHPAIALRAPAADWIVTEEIAS